MIVDPVVVSEIDDCVERVATIRWGGGEYHLSISGPAGIVDTSDDASGFLCATLPLAMRLGEDLRVSGPVSPELLGRCGEIQALYEAWLPGACRVAIEAASEAKASDATREAAFFSRDVDSVFTAVRDAGIDTLVFGDGLEPRSDDAVRAESLRRVRETAGSIGRGLVVAETNLRGLTDPIIRDWEDMRGAGLAFVAHALCGGLRSALVPAGDSYMTVEPAGSSPLLDPLFSSERMRVEHDWLAPTRLDKIRWLAEHRPELIDELGVCSVEGRIDNCGKCGNCLLTMACLHVAGALARGAGFPTSIDLAAVAGVRSTLPKELIGWSEIALVDDDNSAGALKHAVRNALRASAKAAYEHHAEYGTAWAEPRSVRAHHVNRLLSLLVDGKPYSSGRDAVPGEGAPDGVVSMRSMWSARRR